MEEGVYKMKLYVTESSWSGWPRDCYEPVEEFHEYDLVLNEKTVVKIDRITSLDDDGEYREKDEESFSFVVAEIGEDYVVIKTNQYMSDHDNGTINLLSKKDTFRITKGKPSKLTTCSFDSGEIFCFELKE
jgi:hypothetical protein